MGYETDIKRRGNNKMNIKEAKEQIKNAMIAYFTKDEYGEYSVPVEKQRPVFLMGPPGIGKTAIMEQIAAEMNVGLLSYSMTHHTRQSALGLPFIQHKVYDGLECDVSEYTMSEIIASVYDMMEATGIKEGILFLDEINCVSETLNPIMLQFLQYKIFGRHKVPDGWIVVTAGNPPEYNNSVREFDIVTWDRLKRVDVEPDFDVWKEYAYAKAVHPSVLTYLEIKKADFYKVESSVDGKQFVTARGWDDLSQMIKLYELHDIKVDEKLIGQYLQNATIAKDFSVYYDLFNKYRSDYQVDEILAGKASKDIKDRASNARFDERLSLIGLLMDAINNPLRDVSNKENIITELLTALKTFKAQIAGKKKVIPAEVLKKLATDKKAEIATGKKAQSLSNEQIGCMKKVADTLSSLATKVENEDDPEAAFKTVKKEYDQLVKNMKKLADDAGISLSNVFLFAEEVFGAGGQELLIIVTELTANPISAKFISRYGCKEYFKHNKDLLFYERQQEIDKVIEKLKL